MELTPSLQETRYDSGESIVREGDIADRFYIITCGSVEVVRDTKSGRIIVGELSEGRTSGK